MEGNLVPELHRGLPLSLRVMKKSSMTATESDYCLINTSSVSVTHASSSTSTGKNPTASNVLIALSFSPCGLPGIYPETSSLLILSRDAIPHLCGFPVCTSPIDTFVPFTAFFFTPSTIHLLPSEVRHPSQKKRPAFTVKISQTPILQPTNHDCLIGPERSSLPPRQPCRAWLPQSETAVELLCVQS
jgi:hypothetical protein